MLSAYKLHFLQGKTSHSGDKKKLDSQTTIERFAIKCEKKCEYLILKALR